ncbi:exodeoxyribonuclease VII small subunit [Methanohalophilus levihalophilus]|uniref:exodeoxyribonuclease VII small subunit n=1 Tax=Methanohalophilus levihalophilus TaxID=1431282 RepID=UPI001AE211F4|nr:exodeoxyribonuclease VII small subunit [Methanohalophilus levihalophilus]MBP2030736.1 exodeoxyribonuclease VII small subunit [Methanohalophilus levihalophilus]
MANKEKPDERSFEDNLHELEEIVSRLEEGELSLEESMEMFERGMKLSAACNTKLSQMEQRIKVLVEEGDRLLEKSFLE